MCHCRPTQGIFYLTRGLHDTQKWVFGNVTENRKPTDRNKYLLPDSCHPYSNTENIPLSLGIRITRICTEPHTREQRYSELKDLLLDRNYPAELVNSAIAKARSIPLCHSNSESGEKHPTEQETSVYSLMGPEAPICFSHHQSPLAQHDIPG